MDDLSKFNRRIKENQNELVLIDECEIDMRVDPAEDCSCTPYSLLCCCGPQNGISVIQPVCQNLPDGSVVNNPAFVPGLNKSFWTYKFMTDCNRMTRGISSIGIPVCSIIIPENLMVSEKIDGCGTFTPVPFTLTADDPNFGPAPEGFQFLKIETDNRYDKGVTVEYRLEIVGDYPAAIQPIRVKTAATVYVFDCGCFQVPRCNPEGKLFITKECSTSVIDNQAALNYNLTVNNIGDSALDNVQFTDIIAIPTSFRIGTIQVTPPSLNVDTGTPGQIRISGNLGTILPGGQVIISYSIQITGVISPGSYIITNMAAATAAGTQAFANCSASLNAVQLSTDKCCSIDGNNAVYRVLVSSVGASPNVTVNIVDLFFIPGGVTIRFTTFGDCRAVFSDTGEHVPLGVDITGPRGIQIFCTNVLIPQNGSIHKEIGFILVSSSVPGISTIANQIQSVTPTNPGDQLFLGAGVLPERANINVELSLTCLNPC